MSESFAARDEAIDLGRDYEYLIAAYYSLIFSLNDEITNFKISTNNDNLGDFDDVVIEVTLTNGEDHLFALQLKHIVRPIAQITLIQEKSKKFGLKKYSREFQKVKTNYKKIRSNIPFENYHFVLFSNSYLENSEEFDENWKKLEPVTKEKKHESDIFIRKSKTCFGGELFSVSQTDDDFLYEFKSEKENSSDEEFFKQFAFYTRQKDTREMESFIAEIIMKTFKTCDLSVTVSYLNYFCYWCRRDYGTVKLTKNDIKLKLAELVLTPHIPEPSFDKKDYFSEETVRSCQGLFLTCETVSVEDQADVVNRIWSIILDPFKVVTVEWSTPMTGIYLNRFLRSNKLLERVPISAFSENFNQMTLKKLYILFWHLGIIPMVVKCDGSKEEDILLAMKLSNNENQKRKFVLVGDNNSNQGFKYFSDLSSFSMFFDHFSENILISLQGRARVSLKELFATDVSLSQRLTATDFFLMLDGNYVIGEDFKEDFPNHYVSRRIPKIFLDSKVINELENDIFVVSSSDPIDINGFGINVLDIEKCLQLRQLGYNKDYIPRQFKVADLLKGEECGFPKERYLIFAQGECTQQQFEEICTINKEKACHHVRFLKEGKLEWVQSHNSIEKLERYMVKSEDFVSDQEALGYFTNNINIICADPGMGKSIMMKYFTITCPSSHWIIRINLGEHVKFFSQKHKVDDILHYFLESESQPLLIREVVKILSSKNQILFLWDGFDELPEKSLDFVISAVKNLAHRGYPQWVAARTNSRKFLETSFNTLALTLAEFNEENQLEYVYGYLKDKYEDDEKVKEVINEVNRNITTVLTGGCMAYTGIPLQLHMVMEIYLRKPNHLTGVDLITLTDIYQQFIEGKFDKLFEKADADPDNHFMQEIREEFRNAQLVLYENAAMKTSFEDELLPNINFDYDELLDELEDNLGIITRISDNKVIFAHKTYEEFLAASWLSKHCHTYPELVKVLFEKRYNNIRFMFDLLLARDSPIHLAVLYRDLEKLKTHSEDLPNCKDRGGRSALHVASSWGSRHPIVIVTDRDDALPVQRDGEENREKFHNLANFVQYKVLDKIGLTASNPFVLQAVDKLFSDVTKQENRFPSMPNTVTIDGDCVDNIECDNEEYLKLLQFLLSYKSPLENDNLLNWNAIQYADQSFSLEAVNLMVKNQEFLENYRHVPTLVHYSVVFSYDNLLEIVQEIPYIEYKYYFGRSNILHVATEVNNINAVKRLLQHEPYQNVINNANALRGNLLSTASFMGNLEMMDVLIQNGAKINGQTTSPLLTAIIGKQPESCRKLIIAGADVDETHQSGVCPLSMSFMSGELEIFRLLLEHGADINKASVLGLVALEGTLETIQLLLQYKPDVNQQNPQLGGYSPLHFASERGNIDILKCLLRCGADPKIKADKALTPLHVALLNGNKECALTLIEADSSVINEYTSWEVEKGPQMTPLLLAVEKNFPDVTEILIKLGAEINPNLTIKNPLAIATVHGYNSCMIKLIEGGASVNHPSGEELIPPLFLSREKLSAKILLDRSADVNATNKAGNTALHFAANQGNLDVAEELVERGVDINAKDYASNTALSFAIRNKHLQIVQFLLDKNISLENSADLMFLAISNDFAECIPLLVNKGVNVNSVGQLGLTHLSIATMFDNRCLQTLLECGADPNDQACQIPAILTCIVRGKTDILKQLIKAGLDIKGTNALRIAACYGDILSMIILLENGAGVNSVDTAGRTALHSTCENNLTVDIFKSLSFADICINYNTIDCARELIARGVNINQSDNTGTTALHLACQNQNTEFLELLIKHGADVNALDNKNRSPLHICYGFGKLTQAGLLLKHGANLNCVDESGSTPLDNAIYHTISHYSDSSQIDLTELEKILQLGANIDYCDSKTEFTLLHFAASKGDTNFVRFLLDRGANIEKRNFENCTACFFACRGNHFETLSLLLEYNCQINIKKNCGNTPLHLAVSHNLNEITKRLIKAKADSNIVNGEGMTCLHLVAKWGDYQACRILLDSEIGVNLDQTNNLGNTALHVGVLNGNTDVVKLLIQKGVKLDAINNEGITALQYACSEGNLELVEVLHKNGGVLQDGYLIEAAQHSEVVKYLVDNGLDVNYQNSEGITPLIKTCMCNNYNGALHLLEKGANVNVYTTKEQFTPIHFATRNGNLEIVQLLLKHNADLSLRCKSDNSPICIAAAYNQFEILKLFATDSRNLTKDEDWTKCLLHSAFSGSLEILKYLHGNNLAPITATDNLNGWTALHYASHNAKYSTMVYLIEHGADVNFKSPDGATCLYLASRNNDIEPMELLINHNAEVDVPNNHGNTALFSAAASGHVEVVKLLYEKGASVNVIDEDGDAPLHDAAHKGHLSVVKYLVEQNADVECVNKNGKTALDLAKDQGNQEIVDFLNGSSVI